MGTTMVVRIVAGFGMLASAALSCAEGQGGVEALRKAVTAAKVSIAQAVEAAQKEVAGGKVVEVGLEIEKEAAFFEVVVLSGEAVKEVKVDLATGKVLAVTEEKVDEHEAKELAEVKQAQAAAKVTLPQAAAAAEQEVRDGKAIAVELELKDGKPMYEVVLLQGDKVMKAAVDAATGKVGKVEAAKEKQHKDQKAEADEDEEGEDRAHAASKPAEVGDWRQDFKVDKVNWSDHGSNTYFILEPGYRWRYKHGPVVLTITILDETKVVDGVTTRVLEEREEKDGKLLEVSRNYFAIDKATGDVYYFGEDVDEYKNGKLTHEGAWWAGINGARFGLMVPAKPQVGDKFYQEVAPKVAMDRVEVVSVEEQVETPAGTFEKCLHLRETTPLEKDVSHKWYAPGAGLVKDDELVLESVEKPKK